MGKNDKEVKGVKEKEYECCHKYNIHTTNKCAYCQYYDTCNQNKKKEKQETLKRSGIYE